MLIAPQHDFLPMEVHYADEFPTVNFYTSDRDEILQATLGTKARAWEHEHEWRLITDGHQGYRTILPGMIDGVIFGLRTPTATEQATRGWLKGRRPRIKLERIQLRPRSFVLEVVPA
jgi:hypothetical protein